jgi:curved DNA-binding protein CbpA
LEDLYQILGVDAKASDQDIKNAYKRLAKLFHPDKNIGDSKSEEKFKQINAAYQTLSDPWKRMSYDFKREHLHNPSPPISPPPNKIKPKKKVAKQNISIYGIVIIFFGLMSLGAYYFYQLMNRYAAQQYVSDAIQEEISAHYSEAYLLYNQAIELNPSYANAYYRRALMEIYQIGSIKRGKADLMAAIELDSTIFQAYFELGKISYQAGEDTNAINYFNQSILINPQWDSSLYYMADIFTYQQQNYQKGLHYYEQILNNKEKHSSAWAGKAYCYYQSKQYNDAIKAYNKALDDTRPKAHWYYYRGMCYLRKQAKQMACKDFDKAYRNGYKKAQILVQTYCK